MIKKKLNCDDIEKFTVKNVVDKVKNDATTNVIMLTHMPYLTIEEKLYLMYFWGTRKGIPTKVVFEE